MAIEFNNQHVAVTGCQCAELGADQYWRGRRTIPLVCQPGCR